MLNWCDTLRMSGTPGTLLKSRDAKYFYKAPTLMYENGFTGTESFNEYVISELCSLLGIQHLPYDLERMIILTKYGEFDTYVCKSADYKNGQSTIAIEDYLSINILEGEDKIACIKRLGLWEDISNMIILDYIIINRDRHGANIEVYEDGRIVPLYDHGLSLVAPLLSDWSKIKEFDVSRSYTTNNYIGSKYLEDNLKLVTKCNFLKLDINRLKEVIYCCPIDKSYKDKIFEIITWRYANVCKIYGI